MTKGGADGGSDGGGSGSGVTKMLVGFLPRSYFQPSSETLRPVAPVWRVLASFSLEVTTALVAFATMYWYFSTAPTDVITITSSLLPGQGCSVLNPKRGTVYFSKVNSENAQFAKPTNLTSQECEAMLTKLDVCGDGQRHDVINLWGVTNPNNSQYFPGNGSGYLSFTPSQTAGLDTQISLFQGSAVSFPKPSFGGQSFEGHSSDWNLLNLTTPASGLASAVREALYTVVDPSVLLFDSAADKVYDPNRLDFDLSTSSPSTSEDRIGSMDVALGQLEMVDLGVHGGVYYGLQIGGSFKKP